MSSIIGSVTAVTNNPNQGSSGLNYRGTAADLQTPTTAAQANDQYTQAQAANAQQQAFLQAVQAQNGLGNQSSVYNQLQGVTNGTGPNPAQAQLAQATSANVANQNALMAGQRGSSANAGLIARQAAMQGANTQQQAAGQAATLQANQSLNALNSMGSIATNQANQQANATTANTSAAQGEQSQILGGIAAQNNAQVGSQASVNTGQAGLANIAAQGQQGLLGQASGAIGGGATLFGGGTLFANGGKVAEKPQMMYEGGPPMATTELKQSDGPKSKVGQFFSGMAPAQQAAPQSPTQTMHDNIAQGYQTGVALQNAAKGIYNYFAKPAPKMPVQSTGDWNGQVMNAGHPELAEGTESAGGAADAGEAATTAGEAANAAEGAEVASTAGEAGEAAEGAEALSVLAAAKGGKVPALVSPGERYLSPGEAQAVKAGKADPLKAGKKIPGKPKFPGNDYRNDIVPAKLEEGGLVIPNEVMQSKNPHWAAKKFVEAHMAMGGRVSGKKGKK